MKLLIGLDIGTTALKAAVFDTAGKLLAVSTQEYDLITPQVNYVEEKGEVYWNAFKHAVADLKEKGYGLNRCVRKSRENAYREMLSGLGLGLEDKLETKVGSLSGGQRQVLALLMATMTPIDFLILDEHTAALDPRTAEIVMKLTDQIVREKKMTTVMVTHNLRYALEYGDRILMMHQGKIVLDKVGEEKNRLNTDEIMGIFNRISVECGN
mgnify:CR=1 FL=1